MKILLLVDGSAHTTKAAEYLVEHFNWFKKSAVELQLLHVTMPIPRAIGVGTLERNMGHGAISSFYADEGVAALAPAEAVLKAAKIPFSYTHVVGDVAKKIREHSDKNGIDLVVMGSHGRGALKSLVMGSVATKVLAASKVPVLIVR